MFSTFLEIHAIITYCLILIEFEFVSCQCVEKKKYYGKKKKEKREKRNKNTSAFSFESLIESIMEWERGLTRIMQLTCANIAVNLAFSILAAVIRRLGKFPRFQLRELSRPAIDDHDGQGPFQQMERVCQIAAKQTGIWRTLPPGLRGFEIHVARRPRLHR